VLIYIGDPNRNYRSKLKSLGYEHFMKCFKSAWNIAFNKENNMARWRIEGMIPFTRHALWKKVEEDEVNSTSNAGSLLSSTPSPTVAAALASNTTLPTPGEMRIAPPLGPSLLPPLPPLRILRISEAVLIVGDYMQTCAQAASGILNMEAVVMQNIRLLEAAKVFGEWMRTINTKEDNKTNMAKRISCRDIFGHVDNATRDTTLAMLTAKEDKRVVAAAAAAKKGTTKD
jgi:hypothetical protein